MPRHERAAPAPADRATADAVLAAVGLPPSAADGPLPAVLLPVWTRPTASDGGLPLQLHFDLKERFGLPVGLVTACATTYLAPVHHGDRLRSVQVLRSVGDERPSRLGLARSWIIEVEHRNQDGVVVGTESWTGLGYQPAAAHGRGGDDATPSPRRAAAEDRPDGGPGGDRGVVAVRHDLTAADVVAVSVAARELAPVHLDADAARRVGLPDVILGTTGQQAWLWRALVVHLGPSARLARLDLAMGAPVAPGLVAIEVEPAPSGEPALRLRTPAGVATTAAATCTRA